MKDSFLLLRDQRAAFECLPDEDAGKLIKAVCAYQFDGVEPVLPPAPQVAFAMLRPVFERLAAKYSETCRKRREAGAKGGQAKAANASNAKQTKQMLANASNAKQSLHDNDHDNDHDNEKEKDTPPYPPQGGGACALPPAPLSGEDIAERQDGARQERQRGDYEFSLLRDAYNRARPEGQLSGRQEFLRLYHNPDWPGIDELIASVERLLAQDDQWRRGFAPGLGKFLAERLWTMKPRAPAGEREPELTPERLEARRKLEEARRRLDEKLAKAKGGRRG